MKKNDYKFKNDIGKRAYKYSLDVIRFIDELDNKDRSVNTLVNQLLRSSTSIGANIIEAQAGRTKKDFTNFLSHALKSANETKYWLGLLRDSGKSSKIRTNSLLDETTQLANILGASILTLKDQTN